MKSFFLIFLLFSAGALQPTHGQTKAAQTDSLRRSIGRVSGDEKAILLVKLARLAAANTDSSLYFLSQAVQEARSPEVKGKVFFEQALLFRYLERDQEEAKSLDTAYGLLAGVNDSIAAETLHYKQVLLEDKGRYQEALQTGYKALAIRKTLPDRNKELNALLQIGYTYDRMGEYHKAIEWYQKGLELDGLKNEEYIGRNYGLIGIAYDELKDYDKAISYNLKAIEYFKKNPNSKYLHSWYSNLGNTYIKKGDLELAEKYTLLALEEPEKNRYVTSINLGKIYLEKGELQKAETLLKDVLNELKRTDQTIYLSEAYHRLYELYRKKGDFRTALSYFEKYKDNEDERISIAKARQINELTVQYETTEKENQILIQRAKIADHQLTLKNRNFWIFGLGSLVVIIGLIGFLLYKQQLLKNLRQQRENELKLALEKIENQNKLQEQRLSISRDLHDNIGAQLSFIISAVDTIKYYITEKNERLTGKLENISLFARETIQELRDTIWAMNKSGITVNDLQDRIANFIEKARQAHPNTEISVLTDAAVPEKISFTALQGLNIFRIIQEATNNALKYADAPTIQVRIKNESGIRFQITDNGKGFLEKETEQGNGLLNMRKRARELGSELLLQSAPGKGTSVIFSVPES